MKAALEDAESLDRLQDSELEELPVSAAARMWHRQDSHGQILALASRGKSFKPFQAPPRRIWHLQDSQGQIMALTSKVLLRCPLFDLEDSKALDRLHDPELEELPVEAHVPQLVFQVLLRLVPFEERELPGEQGCVSTESNMICAYLCYRKPWLSSRFCSDLCLLKNVNCGESRRARV